MHILVGWHRGECEQSHRVATILAARCTQCGLSHTYITKKIAI
jgi:hypothetical protein